MIGEIHFTREVVDRLIRGELSRVERQVIIEHLDSSGQCEQCSEAAPDDTDDDEQFWALMDHYARLQLRKLRSRAEAGDEDAERELHELRFRALMRKFNELRG